MPTKRMSRIFYIDDLRSGHFCDLPIIIQWAENTFAAHFFSIFYGISLFFLFFQTKFQVDKFNFFQTKFQVDSCNRGGHKA